MRIRSLWCAGVLAAGAATAGGDTATEIEDLMDRVGRSGCTFVRNGSEKSAADARAHLQRKLDWMRSRLETAEDFIEHAASRSSTTGRPYYVDCPGHERETAQRWLSDRLAEIRAVER